MDPGRASILICDKIKRIQKKVDRKMEGDKREGQKDREIEMNDFNKGLKKGLGLLYSFISCKAPFPRRWATPRSVVTAIAKNCF